MWCEHEGFLDLIAANWSGHFYENSMSNCFIKLKYLKAHMKIWNKEVFGNLFENIKEQEQKIKWSEMQLD